MTAGSLQLRQYLRLRRAGTPTEDAANETGIGSIEARLHDKGEEQGEYSNIDTTEMAAPVHQPLTAPAEGTVDQRESVNGGRVTADCTPPMVSSGATIGHNSGDTSMNIAGDALRLFIERVERLEEEKKGMQDDIRDVYAEAKSQGYDPKIMRECVRLRRLEKHARDERQALLETYGEQLGLF